ncbi:MAG TPA: hypothetical protein PKI93_02020 [Alphaproteobacteria bacterium]|nr:hypothetical protein [Alphaproteobacteria bacterium]HNS43922.1 hypothetical protein [Alphaproteobacteria bacterium]
MKTWIIRILLTLIILIGLTIGALNMLAGTSNAHKQGLESAFSGALKGQTTFGVLNAFNVFPQFSVDIEDLYTTNAMGQGDIKAKNVKFSFNFFDLLLKRHQIGGLDITDLEIEKGIYTNQTFFASLIKIFPTKDDNQSHMSITGHYGILPLSITIDMKQIGTPPELSFRFDKENKFSLEMGRTKVSGFFTPGTKTNTALQNLVISRDGTNCKSLPSTNRFTMQSFTSQIFSEIVTSETDKDNLETLCANITKYSL